MRALSLAALLTVGLLLPGLSASAVTIDWVTVGGAGNANDSTGYGGVASAYRIAKYEVTNAQYAEFLNAVAGTDSYALYNTSMGSGFGGITRSGSSGSYTYSVISGRGDMAVNYVSFYDSVRYANWLHNGQGGGDTETGAYTLLGGTAIPSNGLTITRNAGANIFLPSEDEWYKAAYYDTSSLSYYDYPAGTDTPIVCASPGATANFANCGNAVADLTIVGSYTGSSSPNGTFDQGGNVWERNDSISSPQLRAGAFTHGSYAVLASYVINAPLTQEYKSIGFRVASTVPEPGTGLLLSVGVLGFAGWRRRRS